MPAEPMMPRVARRAAPTTASGRTLPAIACVLLASCASSPAPRDDAASMARDATTRSVPVAFPVEIDTPRTPDGANELLADLDERRRRGDRAGVVACARALLRTDFLSDHGRANLYWLMAEASRELDAETHIDALSAFLVAAAALPKDAALVARLTQARAGLSVAKIQARALGRSATEPIVVMSHADAARVIAALPCGKSGGRYVERRLPGAFRTETLEALTVLCSETGEPLTLWFRFEAAD
jgi:hypothetical protein